MKKRTLATGTNTIIAIFAIMAIVGLINFLGYRHFIRADLTETKEYTLSDSTKTICGEIDDLVNITAYFSTDLPPQLMVMIGQIRDLLEEYQAYSGGNIRVEYIDPGSDPEMEQKLAQMRIPKAQLNVIQRDKKEVASIYLGMAIQYGDRLETIPVVRSLYNLEYDLTSRIMKTIRSEDPVVGYLTGHGERDLESLTLLKEELERQYTLRIISLQENQEIAEDVKTLIIAGPGEVSDKDKYSIDQFIMRGGKTIFLVDPIELQEGTLQAMPKPNTLGDMLSHYGVSIGPGLVCDARSNAQAMFNQGFMRYSVPYPYWPRIRTNQFDQEIPAVSMLEALVLPWTGKVDFTSESTEDLKGTILATTSDMGWVVTPPYNLNPRNIPRPSQDKISPQNLVAALIGKVDSFYADKPLPGIESGDLTPASAPLETSKETRIIVVPCASFIEDQYMQMFPFNGTFFLNIVDWLTLGNDLISIRSRQVIDRPLDETSDSKKSIIKLLNTLGIPTLLILFGLGRIMLKRREKRLYEESFRS